MLRKVLNTITRYAHYISCIALPALMLLTISDIGRRAIFGRSVTGTYELTGLLLIIIVFFAIGYAEQNDDHVVIDIVYEILPVRLQKIVFFISSMIYLAIISVMFWRVSQYSVTMMSNNATTATLRIPLWPTILLAAVGIGFYVLSIIAKLIYQKEGGTISNDTE